jgi:glycosyltransferase involved in cell wall biosynthesis
MVGKPVVSVLMPVYNNTKYLEASVRSILNQSLRELELIVIDDGSVEDVGAIIKDLDDDRIVYRRNPENIGIPKSLNIALDLAKGKYITRQDSDDISALMRLELQCSLFTDESVGAVCTYARIIDAGGNVLKMNNYLSRIIRIPEHQIPAILPKHNCVFGPSTMFSRKVFEKIGYFDEKMTLAQDYNYWLRIAQYYRFRILRKVVYDYREHGENITITRQHDWPLSRKLKEAKEQAKRNPIIRCRN